MEKQSKIRIKWEELYKNISKDELLEIISDNKFTVENILQYPILI